MARKWYKGDTHLHTTNSDGVLSQNELVAYCKKIGLDYIMITDHNYNTVDETYYDDNLLVIQGQELTNKPGHVNVWGKKVPHDPPHKLDTAEDYASIIKDCKDAGAMVSANHPYCSNCPFLLDLDDYPFDSIEVWNTVQHSDNIKNRDWWVNKLLNGVHIAAVGGSDFHRDYLGVQFLAMPVTYVHAEDNTQDAILSAIKEGRCFVSNSPKASKMFLSYGDANLGDTARLSADKKCRLAVTKLKKGHRVLIYNNDKVIFDYVAPSSIPYFVTSVDVENAGFIRAEITYHIGKVAEKGYTFVEDKFMNKRGVYMDRTNGMPDFFWAFTNPIWIEK